MLRPNVEDTLELMQTYHTIPLLYELLTDNFTPIRIFSILKENFDDCYILESVGNSNQWDRYSFMGFDPKFEIKVNPGQITKIDKNGIKTTIETNDPNTYFETYLNEHQSPKLTYAPKFTGGFVGYFAYDMARYYQPKLVNIPKDDIHMDDADMYFYDKIVAYDHLSGRAVIIINIDKEEVESFAQMNSISFEQALRLHYEKYDKKAKKLGQLLNRYIPQVEAKTLREEDFEVTSNYTEEEFKSMVRACKDHIVQGDISQVVVSQRFEVQDPPKAFDVYRQLRSTNPSPYLYYFDHHDYQIAGASPEMLVNVNERKIVNKPIAGTLPRGKTSEEDIALEKKLINDPKERAEHTMLVDLGRNDVGRVSKLGSVKVTDFMRVERYSRVMHLVSDVEGILDEKYTSLDALMSILPAGTLSGAPKVRAMEIIDKLENRKRGLYGGTVGYFGLNGDIDTCICIRTVLFVNDKAYVQAGAGIVYDSDPESEYLETKRKAQAVIEALQNAGRM